MNKGPSAFPCPPTQAGGEYYPGWDGMTLRDYFAAKAMAAAFDDEITIQEIAETSYAVADAMLEARDK